MHTLYMAPYKQIAMGHQELDWLQQMQADVAQEVRKLQQLERLEAALAARFQEVTEAWQGLSNKIPHDS